MSIVNKKGVALLMTLSIILLLSIVLMKTFESRTVEIKLLENNINYFRAVTLSRSAFRLLIKAIKEKGVYPLYYLSKETQGIPIPLEDMGDDIAISNLIIKSQDHLFNLNKRLQSGKEREIVLRGLIAFIKTKGSNQANIYELEDQITNFMSALNDWVDPNQTIDFLIDFGNGGEEYTDEFPPFSVKNREFEYLSEVKLLPSFRELQLTNQELMDNFRVIGEDTESIDINLASEEEIVNFLSRYKDLDQYTTIYSNAAEIAEIAKTKVSEENQLLPKEKYKGDITTYRNSQWEQDLGAEGFGLNPTEQALFSFRTRLLLIQYNFHAGKTTVGIHSRISLNYSGSKNTENSIHKITILNYKVN